MAVKIVKTTTTTQEVIQQPLTQQAAPAHSVAVKAPEVVTTEMVALASQLADIKRQLTQMGAYQLLDQFDAIKKDLSSYVAGVQTKEAITIPIPSGGYVKFTAPKKTVKITDQKALKAMVGANVYDQIASVSLTDAKKYVTELQLAEITETSDGARSLKEIQY